MSRRYRRAQTISHRTQNPFIDSPSNPGPAILSDLLTGFVSLNVNARASRSPGLAFGGEDAELADADHEQELACNQAMIASSPVAEVPAARQVLGKRQHEKSLQGTDRATNPKTPETRRQRWRLL